MARPLPLNQPAPALLPARREPFLSVEIAVVTPLFGGSATPGQVDPLLPVRGSSVRGQLRFWWRACRAVQYATSEALFAAESAIWGATPTKEQHGDGPAAVEVAVEILDQGKPVPCVTYSQGHNGRWRPDWRQHYPPYALFPFQGKPPQQGSTQPEEHPAIAREGVRFRLDLRLAAHLLKETSDRRAFLEQEAEGAVWAWIAFGGIGARTRRGCGSLACNDARFAPPGAPASWPAWLKECAGRYVAQGQRQLLVPVLSGARVVTSKRAVTPMVAWNEAVEPLRAIRQQPGLGRNPGQQPNRPGRSRWPEPDSIRQALGIPDLKHPPEHAARPYYPRADLGLPIVFGRMDNPPPMLEASGADGASRLASPLILKPLVGADGQAAPLALLLNAPHVWGGPGVRLKGSREVELSDRELNEPSRSRQVAPMAGHLTARDAVLAYIAKQWAQQEVTL